MWNWLKRLWEIIKGWFAPKVPVERLPENAPPKPQRDDTEWEGLLFDLLEEVDRGATWGQLQGWMMGNDVDKKALARWLRGFGERLQTPDSELLRRLQGLGTVAQGELGRVAQEIVARFSESSGVSGDGEGEGVDGCQVLIEESKKQFQAGNYQGAIDSVIRATQLYPNDYRGWFAKGELMVIFQQYEEAIASFDYALQFQPDLHQAWVNRGIALFTLGRPEEAIASYDHALQLQPDLYQAWHDRGIALFTLGRPEEAIASYDHALTIKPDLYQAWHDRGIALFTLGRPEEAIASYDHALTIKPDYHEAWNNRGGMLFNLGRHEEAIDSYDQALLIKPDYHQAWHNRGFALENLGRNEEAIASYDHALQLQPDYHNAWNSRGIALGKLGRHEEAIDSYDQALLIKPDYHEAWYNRGGALERLGRHEEAIASYDHALQFKLDFHEAWINRGVAAFRSSGYNPWYSQNFASLFKLEVANHSQTLLSSFTNTNSETCFAQFSASFANSEALLLETFKDSPKLRSFLQQPLNPEIEQLFLSKISPQLDKFIQQPLSDDVLDKIAQDSRQQPSRFRPELNLRGYKGQIASLEAELDKAIRKKTHPEGWGILHHRIGWTHYQQGQITQTRHYYSLAKQSYETALETLQPPKYEELHLEVMLDLIKVCSVLGKDVQENLNRSITLLEQRLLDTHSQREKERLARKFAPFYQLEVDRLVKAKEIRAGLEKAEERKNYCLRWMLPNEDSPTFSEMQSLCSSATAILYWHFSPVALTTFIVYGEGEPLSFPNPLESHTALESWLKGWKEDYQAQSKGKDDKNEVNLSQGWKNKLVGRLRELREILNIPEILQQLQQREEIKQLILIPHRDLHLLPLHYYFDGFSVSYLPSAKLGIQSQNNPSSAFDSLFATGKKEGEVSPRFLIINNPSDAIFAETEPDIIFHLCSPHAELITDEEATKAYISSKLQQAQDIVHVSGHGIHNFEQPKYSAIELANKEFLTLEDLSSLSLPSYLIVCLSSCETGITSKGEIVDEYIGLGSGFLAQGTKYVITTLWEVPEDSAGLFMIQFHQYLLGLETSPLGEIATVEAALEAAQFWLRSVTYAELAQWYLRVEKRAEDSLYGRNFSSAARNIQEDFAKMESSQPPYQHPSHWAGFVVTGI